MADDTTTQTTTEEASKTTDTAPDKGGKQQTTTDAKLTQAEVDYQIKQRLDRDREAREKELLETLGVTSRDELKGLLEKQRKADEAALSEADKLKKAAETEKASREKLEQELQKERDQRKQERLDTAIIAAAKGAHDPADVVRILRSDFAESVAKVMNAEGVIDAKAVETLISDLKKKKAYLFGSTSPGSPSNHGGKTPEPDAKVKEDARRGLARQMKRGF